MTLLGLEGELELYRIVKKKGFECIHKLEQQRITDFLTRTDPRNQKEAIKLLQENRMLPREHLTRQVDLLAWTDRAAFAIEEKASNGVKKQLSISEDGIRLEAVFADGIKVFKDSGRQLLLQCKGEGLLSKAFLRLKGENHEPVPVAVVDYEILLNNKPVDWAFHKGVFFVRKEKFEEFIDYYLENSIMKEEEERYKERN